MPEYNRLLKSEFTASRVSTVAPIRLHETRQLVFWNRVKADHDLRTACSHP
jgi:hypothetical protein